MTDYYEDDYDLEEEGQPPSAAARFRERVSIWFGALIAAAIVGGLGLWVYGLTQREATTIPVIRAALDPAKTQPEPSGQEPEDQQAISSYDAGTAPPEPAKPESSPPPEGVPVIAFAPPPERPAAEDLAMGELQSGTASVAEIVSAAEPEAPAPPAGPEGTGSDLAPTASPPVLVRPPDLTQRIAAAVAADSEEAKLAALAEASAVQVQLGAFTERELTEAEWARIYKANEDILHGRALVVQSTISGGRRYFRLRVGPFRDRIEAQNVCRALQARQQDCLVAVNN
ncbi:MAG TPA: SPOR domain-containing protein [Thermohalobaculum sp.]|nr:SPOR domain-containing protein [Thermohalobaculum sp.]